MVEKLSIQIALEGDAEVKQKIDDVAQSFAGATKSISGLGTTGEEALTNAAAAAQKFGASLQDLQKVESIIKALAARASDTSRSFSELASNYDKARAGATKLASAAEDVGASFLTFGKAAGVIGAAVTTAISAAIKTTISFAVAMNKLSEAAISAGQSFEQFSKLRLDLEKMGISGKDATSGIQTFTKSLEKIKAAEIADDLAKTKEKLEGLGFTVKQFPSDPFQAFRLAAQQTAAELPRFIEQLKQMPDSAERSALAIERLGTAAGTSLIQSLKLADPNLSQTERRAIELEQAFNNLSNAWQNFGSLTFSPAITRGINTATDALVAFQKLVTNFSWTTLSDGADAAFKLITGFISAFTLQGMISWIDSAILKWLGLGEAAAKARKAMQAPDAPLPEPGGIPQMAGGGLLGGRGTGTSDSNLAWLSRGEYITPARAVSQPGVLSFLEALRRSGGNLSRVLDGMGRFALGGLVPKMPRFAAGGLAGGSNVTIQFPGLPAIGGLRASANVVEQLHRAAALAQVRSGGRKPSRYS